MGRIRVGVLMGGPSSEREISLLSGRAIYRALKKRGYNCISFDVGEDAHSQIKASGIDVAFIALHGRFGEDGTIQALLDVAGVAYTGSDRLGCSLAMDKEVSKRLLRDAGVPTPDWLSGEQTADAVEAALGLPVIVKASGGGSSPSFPCSSL